MSLWSRIANVFRGDRLNREIDEELESHIAEARNGTRRGRSETRAGAEWRSISSKATMPA